MRARVSRSRVQASVKRHVPTFRKLRLGAERLEPRQLLAGDVSASVVHGTLFITGDNADNFVEVFGSGTPGQFVVEGFTDNHGVNTTINHSSNPQSFSGVTNISVSLKKGDDFFGFEQGTVAGNLSIDMGDGNDEVNVGIPKLVTTVISTPTATPLLVTPLVPTISTSSATINGALCINLGSGNNWLIEGSTHVKGSETVNACDGDDRIEFIDTGGLPGLTTIGNGVTVDHDLCVNLGGGSNYLDAYDLRVNGSFKVSGTGTNDVELAAINVAKDAVFNLCGCGNQDFSIEPEVAWGTPTMGQQNHIGGNLLVNTGSGNDDVTEASLIVDGSNTINTGCGNDEVMLGETLTGGPIPVDYMVSVGKDLCVNLGGGCDTLRTDRVQAGNNVNVTQAQGTADISLRNTFGKALSIKTDGGADNVSLEFLAFNTAKVNLGSGNDKLTVTNCTISTSTFDGGSGVNTYTDGGGNLMSNLTKRHFT